MPLEPSQPSLPTAPATALATTGGPSPVPVVAVAPRAKSSGLLNLLLIGAAIVAIGGMAFAIGRSTAPTNTLTQVGAFPDGAVGIGPRGSFAPGGGGPGGFALGGSIALDGTVKAIDADSLTLTLADGEEMTFKLDGSTTYREASDAAPTDIAVGDQVSVTAGGGPVRAGGNGQAPDLTAGDVTVAR